MSFRKKFFALAVSVMFVILGSCQAFALNINVTDSSHEIADFSGNGSTDKTWIMSIKGGENFSITLTASDLSGTSIQWSNYYWDYDKETYEKRLNNPNDIEPIDDLKQLSTVNFSSSGNTATITGTLNPASVRLHLSIVAIELDSNGYAVTTGDPPMPSDASCGILIDCWGYNQSPTQQQDSLQQNSEQEQDSKYQEENDNFDNGESESGENGGGNGSADDITYGDGENQSTETKEIEHAVITPVTLDKNVIQKLANNISVDVSEIKLLTSRDFSTSTPPEPTDAMKKQAAQDGYELAAKLNTINVREDGWYVFQVTVSDDLVGRKVSELNLYYAEDGDFVSSSASGQARTAFGLLGLVNGVTGSFEVSNLFGVKLDTLPKQFLATMFLSAGKSLTVYIAKILLAILTGCNAGFGLIGAAFGAFLVWKYFKRH